MQGNNDELRFPLVASTVVLLVIVTLALMDDYGVHVKNGDSFPTVGNITRISVANWCIVVVEQKSMTLSPCR